MLLINNSINTKALRRILSPPSGDDAPANISGSTHVSTTMSETRMVSNTNQKSPMQLRLFWKARKLKEEFNLVVLSKRFFWS